MPQTFAVTARGILLLGAFALSHRASAQDIIRYNPEGPEGKGMTGPEVHVSSRGDWATKTYVYYKLAANPAITSGIWETSGFHGALRKADKTEFIHLIHGTITLADADGKEFVFHAGDNFLIPRGATVQWKKTEDVREFWLYFDVPADSAEAPTEAQPAVIALAADGISGKPWTERGETKSFKYYGGADNSWVGLWETKPRSPEKFHVSNVAELMTIVKGSVTLSTPKGQSETFKPGDVVLVPRGTEYKWVSGDARKITVVFDREKPAATAGGGGR